MTKKNVNLVRWHDGSVILGQRVLKAFFDGKLVAKEHGRWRAACEEPGCSRTYDFTAVKTLQCLSRRCTMHTAKASKPRERKRKVLIAGTWTTNAALAPIESRVIWRACGAGDHKRAHVMCEVDKCKGFTLWKEHKRTYVCKQHSFLKTRLGPFQAIYNLFCVSLVARNKKRKKPLLVKFTYSQFVDFCVQNPRCFFCEKDIGRVPYVPASALKRGGSRNARAAYIDRVDPAGHYELSNIVSACGSCNMTKNIFVSHNEMILLGKLRTGRFDSAVRQIEAEKQEFSQWGREVSALRSIWQGAHRQARTIGPEK